MSPEEQDALALVAERADELMQEEVAASDTDLTSDREQGLGEQADEAEAAIEAKPKPEDEPVEVVDEKEEKEETPAKVEDEQEAPGLDARLLHAAERMKWDDEKVAALGDNAEAVLSVVADGFDTLSARHAKLGRRDVEDGKFDSPTEAKEKADLKKSFEMAGLKDEDGDPVFTEDGEKALRSQQDYINVLRDVIQDRILPYVEQAEREKEDREFEKMEEFFASDMIQKSFKGVYGTGMTTALDKDSDEVKARVITWNEAQSIRRSRAEDGEKVTITEALKSAHWYKHQDRVMERARDDVRDELKIRATKISARPTKRQSPGIQPGDEKAVQAVSRRIAEMGLDL